MKVVLLACEVERINTLNYNLVKENELLQTRGPKTSREKDLENKLAIVLAENEKLTYVVDELYQLHQRHLSMHATDEKRSQHDESSEHRINELMGVLEEWKQKYTRLEMSQSFQSGNVPDLQNTIKGLERDKARLTDQLARQDRDLEALRARFASMETSPVEGKVLQQRVSNLMVDNERLTRELELMRLRYGRR